MAEAAIIWCPFPDAGSAREAAGTLLDERLIACANMIPGVHSMFRWQGEREEATECGLLCKTAEAKRVNAMARLAALHPYDTPAIIAWPVQADEGTLAWLETETATAY